MQLIGYSTRDLLLGFTLDICCGDPQWLPHPVRGIGAFAKWAEVFWRVTRLPLRVAGTLFWFSVVGATVAVVRFTQPWANVYWIYSLLACRDLDVQAFDVIRSLQNDDLQSARQKLSWIVGRDTAELDRTQVIRAVIETVAENCNDGVIAPLFYLAIGGPLAMAFYKVVNTLDSTVGYRNTRYLQFGCWSARADDVLGYIPARLSALLIWTMALLPGFNVRDSIRVTLRDASRQPSPNAGFPEAAFAGALGVQLGGLNTYGGVPSRKPNLGESKVPLHPNLYNRTRILLYGSAALFVGILCFAGAQRKNHCR